MLTEIQKRELQQRSLEQLLREKKVDLDDETKSAISYWRDVLVNCHQENQRLTKIKEERDDYKKSAEETKILLEKAKEATHQLANEGQEEITKLKQSLKEEKGEVKKFAKLNEKEKVIANSYKEQRDQAQQQSSQDRINF